MTKKFIQAIDKPYLIGYNVTAKSNWENYMTRTFIELPLFRSKWADLGLTDNDLRRLQEEILSDPKVGAVMKGTGGVRKMRFAFEHQGKSGGTRVIYIDFEVYEKIFLITAYPKNEKDNLTQAERNELRQLVEILEKQLEESNF